MQNSLLIKIYIGAAVLLTVVLLIVGGITVYNNFFRIAGMEITTHPGDPLPSEPSEPASNNQNSTPSESSQSGYNNGKDDNNEPDIPVPAPAPVNVTITFDANKGTVDIESIKTESGTPITLPLPVREGFEFVSWFTEPDDGKFIGLAGENYTPVESITVHAQWIEIPVSFIVQFITFDGQLQPGVRSANEVQPGNSITFPYATRPGHVFTGWYTARSGGVRIGGAGHRYTPTRDIFMFAQFAPE